MKNKPTLNRTELILLFIAFLLYMTDVVFMILRFLGIMDIPTQIGSILVLSGNLFFLIAFWKKIPKYNIALLIASILLLVAFAVTMIF